MPEDLRPGGKVQASHILRVTPENGEVVVGGPDGPIRVDISEFHNSHIDVPTESEIQAIAEQAAAAAVDASPTIADHETRIGRAETRVIDVRKHGAVGDGVTDDTTAIEAALAESAATGRPTFFPAGDFLTDFTPLVFPEGVNVAGSGLSSTRIIGRVLFSSNSSIRDLTVDGNGLASYSYANNGSNNIKVDRVRFTGSTGGGFYLNDRKVTNLAFTKCEFDGHTQNGVQLVDKGTEVLHLEDITFTKCRFYNNGRMNFECIQRSNPGQPVTLGYRNISLYDCVFEKPGADTRINVSYDSGYLDSTTIRSSGYSTVSGCKINGGLYCLEMAGARSMRVIENEMTGSAVAGELTSSIISVSQVTGTEDCASVFVGNRLTGQGDVTFKGIGNVISGNYIEVTGRAVRMNPAVKNVVSGNRLVTTGVTLISLESASDNLFTGNMMQGGSNQTVLNLYTASVNNAFVNNDIQASNVLWDQRDSTTIIRHGNQVRYGPNYNLDSAVPVMSATPTVTGSRSRGAMVVTAASGVPDALYMNRKNEAGTFEWHAIAFRRSGTTANRPDPTLTGTGVLYFDTTLSKPIWSTGSGWVDATGTAV